MFCICKRINCNACEQNTHILFYSWVNFNKTFNFNDKDVQCYIMNCDPWFRGKAAATILEYETQRMPYQTMCMNMIERYLKSLGGEHQFHPRP